MNNLLDKVLKDNKIKNDCIYDWTLEEEKNKYETTNDNSMDINDGKDKKNDNYYHIKVNKKIYYNQFE